MAFNVIYNIIAQDKFSAAAKKITRATSRMRDRFERTSQSISGFAKKFGAVTAAAGAALLAFNKFTDVGGRFQDSLADLSAITGATGKDLKFLEEKSFELGKRFAQSGDQILTAFKLVASAKPELLEDAAALTTVTEKVLLLSNAAGIDLTNAANITAQGLNIFGAGADQAGRFVNVLAAGAKLGSSEIAETGEAMLIAGPAAKAAGLSFEQLNAAIQTVAKGGIKGAMAGTALNSILLRLQTKGVDFQKLGLQGTFDLINKKMNSLTDSTARAQLAAELFGLNHTKVGFALLENSKFLGQYEKTLKGTNIAEEQANIRMGTFNTKARRLGNTLMEGLVRVFLMIEPLLSGIVVALDVTLRFIGRVLDIFIIRPIKIFFTLLGKVAGAISTLSLAGFGGTLQELKEIALPESPAAGGGATVDVNLNAPAGTVKSVKSKSKGSTNLNVGTNMVAT